MLYQGLFTLPQRVALPAKIRPDEAESEGCGGSTVEGENEIWPDFHPSDEDLSLGTPDFRSSPKGRGDEIVDLARTNLFPIGTA